MHLNAGGGVDVSLTDFPLHKCGYYLILHCLYWYNTGGRKESSKSVCSIAVFDCSGIAGEIIIIYCVYISYTFRARHDGRGRRKDHISLNY